jgi:tetratricopeptide (TPR) repeat protein
MRWRVQLVMMFLVAGLLVGHARAAAEPPLPATKAEAELPEPPPRSVTGAGAPSQPLTVDPNLPLPILLQRAGAAFSSSRYDEAIAYLNVAYNRQPYPPLLFNTAQAHRKAAHTAKALELYERFLRENPQSPLVPEAAAHAEAMRARLAADQATEAKTEAEQLARERAEAAERASLAHETERRQAEEALRKLMAQKERPVYKRKLFWGLLGGLVGAGIITGVAVGLALRPPPEPSGSLSTQEVHF